MQLMPGFEQAYTDWKAKNTDPYGARCFSYAECWADLMEGHMTPDEDPAVTVQRVAKDTSHIADTDGITGFMYGMSVSILSKAWWHGEALRRWHNLDTQIGTEGEKANANGGVLNPALLNVGPK